MKYIPSWKEYKPGELTGATKRDSVEEAVARAVCILKQFPRRGVDLFSIYSVTEESQIVEKLACVRLHSSERMELRLEFSEGLT